MRRIQKPLGLALRVASRPALLLGRPAQRIASQRSLRRAVAVAFVSTTTAAAASSKDSAALFAQAQSYAKGTAEVKKDEKKAFELFLQAAQAGHVESMNAVALRYAEGVGCEESPETAIRWLRKAIDLGSVDALFHLANAWTHTWGRELISLEESAKLYVQAADKGHLEAAFCCAALFRYGMGVAKDQNRANEYYFKAAEAGHAEATHYLIDRLEFGQEVPVDRPRALHWLRAGAERKLPQCMHRLAVRYRDGDDLVAKDAAQAAQWFVRAAAAGHAPALVEVGLMHEAGSGGLEHNLTKAAENFHAAALKGVAAGSVNLGRLMFDANHGKAALEWFKVAEQQGGKYEPMATLCLARVYSSGVDGVPKDAKETEKWLAKWTEHVQALTKDAKDNYPWAKNALAELRRQGFAEVVDNPKLAAQWLEQANVEDAKRRKAAAEAATGSAKKA